jgi:hypothetical protein
MIKKIPGIKNYLRIFLRGLVMSVRGFDLRVAPGFLIPNFLKPAKYLVILYAGIILFK